MKPNKPTVIPISQVTSFLCHTGARLSHFQDPPGPSVAVEGGWFGGDLYDGVVFTPTVPAVGSTRIDTVVANPDTGNIELLAGTENSGTGPTIPPTPRYGLVADVVVFSRTNGEILIESADIKDRRSLIGPSTDTTKLVLVDETIIGIGLKNNSADTVPMLVGQTRGPFVCKKQWANRPETGLAFDYGRSSAVEVQLNAAAQVDGKPATDFMLNCQLYGSAIQAGTSESHAHFVGVSWKRLTIADYAGNASFRIEVVASPQDGNTGLIGSHYDGSDARHQSKNVNLHVQLWQRITA